MSRTISQWRWFSCEWGHLLEYKYWFPLLKGLCWVWPNRFPNVGGIFWEFTFHTKTVKFTLKVVPRNIISVTHGLSYTLYMHSSCSCIPSNRNKRGCAEVRSNTPRNGPKVGCMVSCTPPVSQLKSKNSRSISTKANKYIIQQYINSGVETPYKELQC